MKNLHSMGFKFEEDDVLRNTAMEIPVAEDIAKVILSSSENQNDPRLVPYRPGGAKQCQHGWLI